jgi:hypothetical protein
MPRLIKLLDEERLAKSEKKKLRDVLKKEVGLKKNATEAALARRYGQEIGERVSVDEMYHLAAESWNAAAEAVNMRIERERRNAANARRREGRLPTPNRRDSQVKFTNDQQSRQKRAVDVYSFELNPVVPHAIDTSRGVEEAEIESKLNPDWMKVLYRRVFPMLKSIKKKYGSGQYQIDLRGYWGSANPEGAEQDDFENEKSDKICIRAFDLVSENELSKEWEKSGKGASSTCFYLKGVDIKVIIPLKGGCWSCKGHGKMMKLKDLTLFSPYSTNNNCLFRLIEEYASEKMTKTRCNEIRAEFGIQKDEMIDLKNADRICRKYSSKGVCFIANDAEINADVQQYQILFGEPTAPLKFLLLNNHYMRVDGKNQYCTECGKVFIHKHTCNPSNVSYFLQKVKKCLIEKIKRKVQANKNKKVLHYDIESQYKNRFKQHKPYIVGLGYYDVNEELQYHTFEGRDCMARFYQFLGSERVKHITHVNAFNGSGFDHYYLFREKLKDVGAAKVGKFILNNGALLSANIQGKTLIDLGRHLTGSLEANLIDLGCEVAKGSIDHNISDEWENTGEARRKEVKDYLKCDVMGLLELYEKANSVIFDKYNMNLCDSMTTSACAFAIWRDKYLEERIYLLDNKWETNVRQSVYGGRVYKNRNSFISAQYEAARAGKLTFDEITDFIFDADVNSLYPTAMKNFPYPVGKEMETNIYHEGLLGVYNIKYIPPKNILTPILPRKEGKKLIWDLQDGEGWYTSVDIENAKAHGYQVEVVTGVYWEKSAFVFEAYVDEFYKMKANAPKGTPEYTTAKLYMNGLYGKMIQRPITAKDSIITTSEEFWSIINTDIILEMHDVEDRWMVKHVPKEEFLNPSGSQKPTQLGAFVLSYSRKIMTEYYDLLGSDKESLFYYCDTDSINIHSSTLPKISHTINSELGGMSDDVGGKVLKAIYIAPKMYAFQYVISKKSIDKKIADAEKKNKKPPTFEKLGDDLFMMYHFRGKGVSTNKLTWEAFEEMHSGMEKVFFRDFQMKKIHTKRNSKQKDLDVFCHKHIDGEDTAKAVNRTKWEGRFFPKDAEGKRMNFSYPYGHIDAHN